LVPAVDSFWRGAVRTGGAPVLSIGAARGSALSKEMTMRKIVVSEFVSLDGVMQAPGGADEDTEGGFAHGGWTHPYWHDDIGAHFFQAMSETGALLLGRKTWQGHGAAFDPMPEGDPFGDPMKKIQKYVVSTTLKDTSLWRNSTIISSNVVEEVRKLKAQEGGTILLDGSSVLAHTLIENDLVDEYTLHVYPLTFGTGKKLFPADKEVKLKLVEATSIPTGVVYVRYRRGE
jgi:dihydrofolate reductase